MAHLEYLCLTFHLDLETDSLLSDMHETPSIVSAMTSNLDSKITRVPDVIHEIVLKKCPEEEAATFSKLYNKCCAAGSFPAVPISKKSRDLLGFYVYLGNYYRL